MFKFLSILITLSFLIIGCSSPNTDLPNFNEGAWKKDKDGCDGIRQQMRSQLIESKELLKGMNGDEISDVLGKPNNVNLAKRNQKYFIYNITCATDSKEPSTLSIRFNATGLSYEVVVY